MGAELIRYLWWWVDDNKKSTLVVAAPLLVLLGPVIVAGAILQGDPRPSLGGIGLGLIGLFVLFIDFIAWRGDRGRAPWNNPPRYDPTGRTPPWSAR